MALSPADQALIDAMKQRQLHIKAWERTAEIIHFKVRRFRMVLIALAAVLGAATLECIAAYLQSTLAHPSGWWRLGALNGVAGAILGALLGERLLRTRAGLRLLAERERRLRRRYSGDLHAGRRWLQFYYRDEEISAYVPQLLYFVDAERRFDSVDAALDFVRQNRQENAVFAAHARSLFDAVAAEAPAVVVASSDESGRPSSRIMRFVRSDRPGVWYVTTAPEGPKVHELDLGRVAVVTVPTSTGATISSNRARARRAGLSFGEVADLYRAQVPGYSDGMTEDEQARELVYEIALESARVETWTERATVDFREPEPARGP
jgi:hypothetical protein